MIKQIILLMCILTFELRGQEATEAPLSTVDTLVLSNNELGFELFTLLKKREENLIFSPYNLATALQMAYMGSAGLTQSQMARTLHFSLPPKELEKAAQSLASILDTKRSSGRDALTLSIANSLWVQSGQPILPSFADSITQNFNGSIKSVNFKTMPEIVRREINEWVRARTQSKIVDLLQPNQVAESTRLLLISALYMQGKWQSTFDPSLTKFQPFFPSSNETLTLPTMHHTSPFPYLKETDFAMIELNYMASSSDPKLALYILLPRDRNGLESLESRLNSQILLDLAKRLKKTSLTLSLPKFKITSTLGLKSTLEMLGLTEPFSNSANFSAIDGTQNLVITDVVQKGFLAIDEKGTEAGVATAVSIGLKSLPPEPTETFNVDHPFLFFIADKGTGSILFLGRIIKPES